ncbi:alanine--tRNA ligase [Candidatus Pacearchaeota archaeon]|nr:alanine--tRNA ligase [Candidatus Pacearchaeota archaeon]
MSANQIKTRQELIKSYLDFFKSKNHKIIPSSSLIPENDPTVLFTTAGMHPLVPFLLGQKHPLGKRLADVQKCIRTQDIDEVGDNVHHTFFEMLGNWSLGDYFKKEAIKYSFEFLTKNLKIPKENLAVTCFEGDRINKIPKDEESSKIWQNLGIKKEKIVFLGKEDNWWGPAGQTGPCGPDTEMFFYSKSKTQIPKAFNPKDKNWVEIWNDVFMQYNKTNEGKYMQLNQKNVDTGMGVERTLAVLNGLNDNYQTSIFQPIIKEIEKISHKSYSEEKNKKPMRIIADHIRASVFILGDDHGIKPSNTEQGYVLRRLIRRAIRYGKLLGIKENFTSKISKAVIPIYSDYQELKLNEKIIINELEQEEIRFNQTLQQGLKKFEEIIKNIEKSKKEISGKDAFLLFQSYGFPIEMTQELAREKILKVNLKEYNSEFEKHQTLSRTSSAGMFKSGLADNSETTKKLHTATHLLNEALRIILKDKNIKQKGSNITPERLRFDFNFPRKLTEYEIKEIEDLVNKKIKEKIKVTREEMPLNKALSSGAQAEFGAKYPSIVSVYTIGSFSKEICTGPHVSNTSEIGHFKIIKEESVAAGIRRIKAIVD